MDDGIKKITRSIEIYGLCWRISVMLALAAACLLALRSLQTREADAAVSGMGSQEELERMLRAELPLKFSGIIIQGKISRTTAEELYQQHRVRFKIRNWRYHPYSSRYAASIKLSWQPDETSDTNDDFWLHAQCSLGKNSSSNFLFKVCETSPDYEKACRAYFDVILNQHPMR